jgi:hypothetical protein
MNERIRELVRQAVITVDIVTGNEALDDELAKMYIPDCFSEKFAELIVRECVMKLKETKKVELPFIQAVNEHAQELPLSVYIAELKEHFGVEE